MKQNFKITVPAGTLLPAIVSIDIDVPAPVVTQSVQQQAATEVHTITGATPPIPPIPAGRKNLILNMDFALGKLPTPSQLSMQPTNRFIVKPIAGKTYCEVTVAKNDAVIPAGTGTNRSEMNVPLAQAEPFKEMTERWYGIRYNLPQSFINDPSMELVFQEHEFSGTASPHFAIWTQAGRWTTAIDGKADFDMGAYEFDKDIDFVFHIIWSTGDKGLIEIYKDGKLLKSYPGANMPVDTKLPYTKCGIYKWQWVKSPGTSITTSRTINIGCLYIGNEKATINDVTP